VDNLRDDIRGAFERHQQGLGETSGVGDRLLWSSFQGTQRRNLLASAAGAAATVVVAIAIAVAVLLAHRSVRPSPSAPATVEEALTSGPAAAVPASSPRTFVWLTAYTVQPTLSGAQGGSITGIQVDVIDWSGRVRYHFTVPNSSRPGVPNDIQSISPDGTRALLADGTILSEKGTVVGRIPALTIQGMPAATARWMADDQHICASFSNEPVASYPPTHPKGAPNATPTPAQPYTQPGADHSVTLKVFGLDGSVRSVATVGAGPLTLPSGAFGDATGVLACNATNDLAVVARYHDADVSGSDTSNNFTVSVWTIKLSTGSVLYHQPETKMASGRVGLFYGSQNGRLAAEFLWNSKVWGSETDVVLQMPGGKPVPVLDAEPIPDTPGLSADGTRILRRLVDDAHNQTDLELIDASSGRIIRRVALPGTLGASAVALPGSASFLVQVKNYLAFVDGNGGITLLHPNVNLADGNGPGGVSLPPMPIQN
jgi:hypothetical protein